MRFHIFFPYGLLVFCIGILIANASIYRETLLQLNTPTSMTGRVFSISSMIGNITLPISYGISDIVLNHLSLVSVMIFPGAALLLTGTLLLQNDI